MDLTYLKRLAGQQNLEKRRAMPGFGFLRRDMPSEIESSIYEPVLCLILQGSKTTSVGDQIVELEAGDALLVSHDLPVVSRITKASPQAPYLAVILSVDLQLARSLHDQISGLDQNRVGHLATASKARSLNVGIVDEELLALLGKYASLIDRPTDAAVIGPATLREIHYRLLISPIGDMLRSLLSINSHASRIAKAIERLRSAYTKPLQVADLARTASMSTSSFHVHFRSVTGTTPLQYQKDLRLIAAQTLLTTQGASVSDAAYGVGYQSPNHFSRDYSRKFGLSPSQTAGANAYVATTKED
jgi:AraC-like DNA-binding protein